MAHLQLDGGHHLQAPAVPQQLSAIAAEGFSQLLVATGMGRIPPHQGQRIGRGLQGIPELESVVTVLLRYGRVIGSPAARGYLCPG
jgi:hypothetical protein